MGLRKPAEPGREPGFIVDEAAGKERACTGLLKVGTDALMVISGFLSWEMRLQAAWKAHDGIVRDLHFSPNGKMMVTGSEDHKVRLWDIAVGKGKDVPSTHSGKFENLRYSLEGLQGHSDVVRRCVFSSGGACFVSASFDKTVKLWDAKSGILDRTLVGHTAAVMCVDISPDGSRILSGCLGSTLLLWNARTGVIKHNLQMDSGVWAVDENFAWCCSFHPDGTSFLAGCDDSTLRLFDCDTCQLQGTFTGHSEEIKTCCFNIDGSNILSGSADATMKLWSTATGQLLRTLVGHSDQLLKCVFSPDQNLILSTSTDQTLMLWEASTGRLLRILDGHPANSAPCTRWNCSFSPDGRSVVGARHDGYVEVWWLGMAA
jgi:WD40 repeat protein